MTFPDETLLQLSGGPDVWMVMDGARVRIGSTGSNVLEVIRRSPGDVLVVDQSTLDLLPVAPLPSTSDIPGSLVFPPLNDEFGAELGTHFVVRTPGTTRVVSQQKELRSVTVRGWLHPLPPGFTTHSEPRWDDWHYWLDLDPAWLAAAGLDPNALMRIGNFAEHGRSRVAGSDDFFTWAGTAYVHLEINGWKPGNSRGVPQPTGWDFGDDPGFANVNAGTRWPFDPRLPASDLHPPYVEVSGSLIADRSHVTGSWASVHAVGWWRRGISNDAEESPIRAAEIHPPDRVVVLPPVNRTENLYGVAVVAGSGILDQHRQEIDAVLGPPGAPPSPAHYADVVEYVGPESYLDTLALGNPTLTGAEITVASDAAVRVRVAVETRLFGKVGKFKAVYRVYWQPLTVEDYRASGFVLFLPPTVVFRLRSPRRATLPVRLEVRHGTGDWKTVVSDDPFGDSGALVGPWAHRDVPSNTAQGLFCFWLGRALDGSDFKAIDGAYTFRLTVLRIAGGPAVVEERTVTIDWGHVVVACATKVVDGFPPFPRVLRIGGPGWSISADDAMDRIQAGGRFVVDRPGGSSTALVVGLDALGRRTLTTESEGPLPLWQLPTCA